LNPHLYATEAVVLERRDFGEADRLLTLYTPVRGKVRAIARGSRRTTSRLAGHVELFTHTRVLLASGRNLDIVTQCELLRGYERLREDLWRLALGYHVVELVNRFSEERLENYDVWQALLEVLDQLDADDFRGCLSPELSVRLFELRLLNALGYRPQLRVCTGCGSALEPIENYFAAAVGGLLCPPCAEGQPALVPVAVETVKVLRVLQDGDHALAGRLRLPPETLPEMERVLRRHIIHVLEHDLHTTHLLDELRAQPARGGR